MKTSKAMSRAQAYRFHTDRIRQWLNHGAGVLPDILAVKRGELWKEKWSSWREYCEKEFGKSRQRAYELLDVAGTIEEISSVRQPDTESGKNKEILSNMNYRQAKALSGLTPIQKAEVFHGATAVEGGKAPSAKTLKTVREALVREPEVRLDKVGRQIPPGILNLWDHADETGKYLRSKISEVKCELEKGIGQDIIFGELINAIVSDLKAVHYSLSQVIPYAVCPTCQGRLPDKCLTCRHRGFISQFYYEGPAVGSELRAIIEKQGGHSATRTSVSA